MKIIFTSFFAILLISLGVVVVPQYQKYLQILDLEKHEAEELVREKEALINYFNANREEIISSIEADFSSRDYQSALTKVSKYGVSEDEYLTRASRYGKRMIVEANHRATILEEDAEIEIEIKTILVELKGVPVIEYKRNKNLYGRLVELNSANKKFSKKLAYYTSKVEERRIKLDKQKEDKRLKNRGLKWNYIERKDTMTRETVRTAIVKSLNLVNFDFPYQGRQRAKLRLRKHPKYGNNVLLGFSKGQFLCNSRDCEVSVRFDNGKPVTYSASEPDDHSTNLIFIRGYDRFVSRVKKSKKIYIQAQFYQNGLIVMEFDTEGLRF